MDCFGQIRQLRLAVGFLGERSQHRWWDTTFLNATGLRFLELVYPRSSSSAALTSASEAACRVHDERIGRGRVAHLFRLPSDAEARLRRHLPSLSVDEVLRLCSGNASLDLLTSVAGTAKTPNRVGPIQIGSLAEAGEGGTLVALASAYLTGFRANIPVFPYLA